MNLIAIIAVSLTQLDASQPLERADWVVTWSEYVETAKNVWSPAPGAVRRVLSPEAFQKRNKGTNIGLALSGSSETVELLEVGPKISVEPGAITELVVGEGELKAVRISGRAAQAFWTLDHRAVRATKDGTTERRESKLILLGTKSGVGKLALELADGSRRMIEVHVPAKRR